jgi:hypothetical protein
VNLINVALVVTAIVIILSQNWLPDFKGWVQGKVGETQVGQTKS